MNTLDKRLWLLAVLLVAGFSCVFLLPKPEDMKPSRMLTEMPETIDAWSGVSTPVSAKELSVLAEDTLFERKVYTDSSDPGKLQIETSLVFSGKDMNSSIHRPEVCMRTQGWNFVSERYRTVESALPDGGDIKVREIVCSKARRDPESGDPIILPNGEILVDWQLLFYTFIGSEAITPSHYGRALTDIKDRVLGGFDQQWAYATFATGIPGKYADQGLNLGTIKPLSVEETEEQLSDFIRLLLPTVLRSAQD